MSTIEYSTAPSAYTLEEDMFILNYIIKNEDYWRVRSQSLWEDIEAQPGINRTWQSLRERFIKKISTMIYKYNDIGKEQQALLYKGFIESKKLSSNKSQKAKKS